MAMMADHVGGVTTAENLAPDTKLVLEEVTRYIAYSETLFPITKFQFISKIRYLNLEKLLPSYKYTVTKSCLKAIRRLQKLGHLPSKAGIFKDYAGYGQLT